MSRVLRSSTIFGWPTAIALLLVYGALAWSSVREKSGTFDEIAHLTGGYSYWQTGDYRMNPENGVFPQRWAALPLLAMDVRFPSTDDKRWHTADVWEFGRQFFYHSNNDLHAMLWWSRGMIVLLGMALGAAVYAWSRKLFGPAGGIISLVACVFCPSIVAHGQLVTSDIAVTLAFVASLGCLWKVMHRVSVATVAASAVALGFLFVAKFSAVLVLPVAAVMVAFRLAAGLPLIVQWRGWRLVRDRRRQAAILAGVAAIHAVVVIAIIWAFFAFHYATFREAEPGRDTMYFGFSLEDLTKGSLLGALVRGADDLRILPEPYLYGFAAVVARAQARIAFLNGEISTTGWRMFFPYSLLVKTPLPTFGLMLAAAGAIALRWTRNGSDPNDPHSIRRRALRSLYRSAPLWLFFLLYWYLAIRSNMNIGHRHILPTYPMMFIFCGAASYWWQWRNKLVGTVVALLLALLVADSLRTYPHYLAYFNRLDGGPEKAYLHLVDSSLDWGQDLPGLKRWLAERPDSEQKKKPVYLSYFGTGSPEYEGLEVRQLPGYIDWRSSGLVPLEPGTYCISASMRPSLFIDAMGDWNVMSEVIYRRLQGEVDALRQREVEEPGLFEQLKNDPARAKELAEWNQTVGRLDQMRLGRLLAYLRTLEPDDAVGHSILIYYLDQEDLDKALTGPIEMKSQ